MNHLVTHQGGTYSCTCGKVFYVRVNSPQDSQRAINLSRANAHRHANAANKKEQTS